MSARYQALVAGGVYDFQTGKIIHRHDPEWSEYQRYLSTDAGGVMPPTALPADQTIGEIREILRGQIKDHATSLKNRYTPGQSLAEVSSWYIKAGEARSVKSKPDSTFATLRPYAPTLCAEVEAAADAGATQAHLITSLRNLANSVLENYEPYISFVNSVQAASKRHRDALDAMADKRDLLVYDWMADWPEV
ncbi:MAG: hypothetical protein LBI35_07275 [Burkholderiales bacterium]|jgi:hypothetical protein|nr:hypothetical protein [Burkholderiales bacterium]